ncbi:MAG: hypothetical protein ACD_62C00286G0001 [uncultured bacterium]|nr:MAG: hypothetical protein ACD_62C00286G0001 [uncultured bacterium]
MHHHGILFFGYRCHSFFGQNLQITFDLHLEVLEHVGEHLTQHVGGVRVNGDHTLDTILFEEFLNFFSLRQDGLINPQIIGQGPCVQIIFIQITKLHTRLFKQFCDVGQSSAMGFDLGFFGAPHELGQVHIAVEDTAKDGELHEESAFKQFQSFDQSVDERDDLIHHARIKHGITTLRQIQILSPAIGCLTRYGQDRTAKFKIIHQ